MPVTQAAKQAKVSEKRTIDVYQYLRDVCSSKLLAAPIVLGGPGIVVQIDESLFVHSQKVQLVDATFMLFIVQLLEWPRSSSCTGTMGIRHGRYINDDQWASYNNVASLPGIVGRQTINHSVQFVTGSYVAYCHCT